jgi:anti-sigma28 factor (negative regulator of flagellin synthesis)
VKINEREALDISKPQTSSIFDVPKPSVGSAFTPSRTDGPADGIDLGSQSDLVARAQTAGAGDSTSRVEQLRALVQSGQYQVDTVALSKAIVGAALNGY